MRRLPAGPARRGPGVLDRRDGAGRQAGQGRRRRRTPIEFDDLLRGLPVRRRRASATSRRLYQLARQTTRGFESYARRLAKRYRRCPQLLEDVLDGLFHIAASDGVVTADELAYLERVGELFGLSPADLPPAEGDPPGRRGTTIPTSSWAWRTTPPTQAVRAAWKAQLSEAHPDRARARGLPAEFIEVAEAKAAAINAAFDAVDARAPGTGARRCGIVTRLRPPVAVVAC